MEQWEKEAATTMGLTMMIGTKATKVVVSVAKERAKVVGAKEEEIIDMVIVKEAAKRAKVERCNGGREKEVMISFNVSCKVLTNYKLDHIL